MTRVDPLDEITDWIRKHPERLGACAFEAAKAVARDGLNYQESPNQNVDHPFLNQVKLFGRHVQMDSRISPGRSICRMPYPDHAI